MPVDPKVEKHLRCYLKRDRPFLLLAPIKVEILLLDPLVVIFKDVLSHGEVDVIKTLAIPKVSSVFTSMYSTFETDTPCFS